MGNIRNYLPSGQFSVIVLSIIIVAGLIGFASILPKEGKVSYSTEGSNSKGYVFDSSLAETDSDQDGLKDWQEALWKTDPNKKDSDGDGTEDGEEVENNRNPNLKGPGDELSSVASSQLFGNGVSDLSPTEVFAREFLSEYSKVKKSGGELTGDSQTEIITNILSNPNIVEDLRQYSEGELIVSNDNSPLSLKKYGNTMGEILKENPYRDENEISILNRALQSEDEEILLKLDPIISSYENILNKMLKVSTPKEAVQIHLYILDSTNQMLQTIKNFRNVFEDPVSGMVSIGNYEATTKGLLSSFVNAQEFFKQKGISFSESETGSYFVGSTK